MLNGDAHHSDGRDGELRIWPLFVLSKTRTSRSIAERSRFDHQFFRGFWSMPHCSPPTDGFSERQRRLLYVGSDLALLKFLRSTFGKPKYHVVSCPDRDSAERFIKSDIPYELFVFDLEMRHRAAFDLTQLVRSLDHRERLPAIIVGSEVNVSLGEFTIASGGNDYVQKQNHFEAIHEAISRLLEPAPQRYVKTKLASGTASRPDKGS